MASSKQELEGKLSIAIQMLLLLFLLLNSCGLTLQGIQSSMPWYRRQYIERPFMVFSKRLHAENPTAEVASEDLHWSIEV